MFDQPYQMPMQGPMQMDPRVQQRQQNGMNPMHHGLDMGGLDPNQPIDAQANGAAMPRQAVRPVAPPTEIDKFNQWLAQQGSGRLNIDPNNPSAAIGKVGTAPIQGAFPVGAKLPDVPGQQSAAPANTFNRGAGLLPPMPTSPSQAGYLDAHAKAMGVGQSGGERLAAMTDTGSSGGQMLSQLMKSNPELGTMLARTDAMNGIQQGRQQVLDKAAVGDPTAIHSLLSGYNDVGITPGQGAATLAGMRQGQAASLAEREFGLKKSEHDIAVSKLSEQTAKDFAAEIAKIRAENPGLPIETARQMAIENRQASGLGLPSVPGQSAGPQRSQAGPVAGAPTGGPVMAQPDANSALQQIAAKLRRTDEKDPTKRQGGDAKSILTSIYTLDQANPGLMQNQSQQIMQMLAASGLGPDALKGELDLPTFNNLSRGFHTLSGSPISQQDAALEAWRRQLGLPVRNSDIFGGGFRNIVNLMGGNVGTDIYGNPAR